MFLLLSSCDRVINHAGPNELCFLVGVTGIVHVFRLLHRELCHSNTIIDPLWHTPDLAPFRSEGSGKSPTVPVPDYRWEVYERHSIVSTFFSSGEVN